MQNRYPLWKYLLLISIGILGIIYTLPNLYGEDPAVQIAPAKNTVVNEQTIQTVQQLLDKAQIHAKSIDKSGASLLIRFDDTDAQFKAKEVIEAGLPKTYSIASNFASATPAWLNAIGAEPMKLGLDLRGGIHLLLEVDTASVLKRREEGIIKNVSQTLRTNHIRYSSLNRSTANGVLIGFRTPEARDSGYTLLHQEQSDLVLTKSDGAGVYLISAALSPQSLIAIDRDTIEQTMRTLRNRVNELGVGETVVQQQGLNRIAVDLPGIQDATRAQEILGGTATLEFHIVNDQDDAQAASSSGVIPVGSRLYQLDGRPLLLFNSVVLSGESIAKAMASFSQDGTPAVSIQLSGGNDLFSRTTAQNIGKRMGIVFIETKTDSKLVNGKIVRTSHKEERVISAPVIRSALPSQFEITGLSDMAEARDLSLYLRAGALVANIYPVEERIVGPTLGKENIRRGLVSLMVGMGIILLIMAVYYRTFGLVANVALLMNVILLTAILSILKATLTLAGIAGIVLTVGMAVDANVLIYERIREEMRNRMSPQAAIYAGYERAFATIVDANMSTFIVAIVLYAAGTGPFKAFAIVLALGLLTSMLTGITFTRAIVNLIYGNRKRIDKLSIGTIVLPNNAPSTSKP